MTISSFANTSLEDITTAAEDGLNWFQLYMSPDEAANKSILDDAIQHGAKAIVLTVDAIVSGNREQDIRNRFRFSLPMPIVENYKKNTDEEPSQSMATFKRDLGPEDVKWIAEYTNLPVIVKGIQSPRSAELALEAGAQGIWVSNHGGRQLDGGPASFDSLELIAQTVNQRVPIIFDGGVRRGQHVFKALAQGADLVAIGRPATYGLALGGASGVQAVFDHLKKDLEMVMQLSGTKTIKEIKQSTLRHNTYLQ